MADAPGSAQANGSNSLSESLEALRSSGADRFDPVRFRFIEALAGRTRAQGPAAARRLEHRALQAVDRYHRACTKARGLATSKASSLSQRFPEPVGQTQGLVEAGEFGQLKRVEIRLQRSARRAEMSALLERLACRYGEAHAMPDGAGMEHYLRQQEQDMISSLGEPGASVSTLANPPLSVERPELRSMRRCRESQLRRGAETLVARTMGECPENAGPLNSERLAMRSLSIMHELSPRYLHRFAAYLDTLHWLEEAGHGGGAAVPGGKETKTRAGAKKSRRKRPQP